ncbi:hypothetical protein BJ742DRAFT_816359 [Cladochytrium replicatum]|nr:hypothetical protein BJ742DRAFT_816359 [Cladochytrium replicatum]
MALQWRQFSFFDREEVVDAQDHAKVPQWLQNLDITAFASGRGNLFFGSADGTITVVNHFLSVVMQWQGYPKKPVSQLKQIKSKNVLVTIGEDENGVPVVKVWNMEKFERNSKTPVCTRSTKVQYNNRVFPVTALAVLDNMTQVAVGLENGVVVLIRGDIARDRFHKQRIIHEGSETVTGLGFSESKNQTVLFIVTLARVLTCITSNKEVKTVIDEQGSEYGCSVISQQEVGQDMVVARNEAVYFYGPEGRGPCFIIESDKRFVTWFRNFLVVVSQPPLKTVSSGVGKLIAPGTTTPSKQSQEEEDWSQQEEMGTVLTMYDLRSKFVAFSGSFGVLQPAPAADGELLSFTAGRRGVPIKAVCSEGGELFVITVDKKMYRLEEKDLSSKLDILFQKNMYQLAISMVTANNNVSISSSMDTKPSRAGTANALTTSGTDYDYGTLVEIYKRYGDWLYSKGEYDTAMQQYLRTVGQLEPSYIIRKFLDAQRIHNLTSYLQALHEHGLANSDHTTLLLNCYTKLKDVKRLDEFIKTDGKPPTSKGSESDLSGKKTANFDVETAIRVCRQAGYFDHALYLAKKYDQHEWYLKIQVEDLRDFKDTVENYVSKLPGPQALAVLKRYGHVLITELPREMTDVLVRLCTERKRLGGGGSSPPLSGPQAWRPASPEDLTKLYVTQPEWCAVFLERVLEKRWGGRVHANAARRALSPQRSATAPILSVPGSGTLSPPGSPPLAEKELIILDPAEKEADDRSHRLVCDTLLELYLGEHTVRKDVVDSGELALTRVRKEEKAMALLKNPAALYDVDQALMLCKVHRFEAGVLYLYEKQSLHKDTLLHYMEVKDYAKVLETCRKHGEKERSLWIETLAFFAASASNPSQNDLTSSAQSYLTMILDDIDKMNLLPPLQVLQILAKNPAVTVGMVRDFIVRRVEAEKKGIAEDQRLIQSYTYDTQRMRSQLHELQNLPIVFQSAKCNQCNQLLELPTVHFMCKHSFHQRCLGDNDSECPMCSTDHRAVQELVKAQEVNAARHDVFLNKLDREKDRFGVIAEYFSKNVFLQVKPLD